MYITINIGTEIHFEGKYI